MSKCHAKKKKIRHFLFQKDYSIKKLIKITNLIIRATPAASLVSHSKCNKLLFIDFSQLVQDKLPDGNTLQQLKQI